MTILIFAREAGGAFFLADGIKRRVEQESVNFVVLANQIAADRFAQTGILATVIDEALNLRGLLAQAKELLNKYNPNEVWVSATPGYNLEKALIKLASSLEIRTKSFVDHFWNLWQRFADPRSFELWKYCPDVCVVISNLLEARLKSEGCQVPIEVLVPPRLQVSKPIPQSKILSRNQMFDQLELSNQAKYFVFVSESVYSNYNKKWAWDQAEVSDYIIAARALRDKLMTTPRTDFFMVLKKHPSERRNWEHILGRSVSGRVKILERTDNLSLVTHASFVVGLNSMMLLESCELNAATFVYRNPKLGERSTLLHKLFPERLPYISDQGINELLCSDR